MQKKLDFTAVSVIIILMNYDTCEQEYMELKSQFETERRFERFVDEINDYIDTTVMEKNEDYSNRLVGQLKTEKSAQLDFPLKGTETGEQFKKVLENFPDAEMTEVKIKKGEKNE